MKKILPLFLLIFSSATFAQSSTTYKTTLKQMLESAGTEAVFKTAIKQMFDMYRSQKTNVPEEVWNAAEAEFNKSSMEELIDMLTPVYEKHFTEADLKKVIEFYQTPAGKKYAEKAPLLMEESMQIGQQWGMKVGQRLAENLKAKGY